MRTDPQVRASSQMRLAANNVGTLHVAFQRRVLVGCPTVFEPMTFVCVEEADQ